MGEVLYFWYTISHLFDVTPLQGCQTIGESWHAREGSKDYIDMVTVHDSEI